MSISLELLEDNNPWEKLSVISYDHLQMKPETVVRYLSGYKGLPLLRRNVRIKGDVSDWTTVRIHKDDVHRFVHNFLIAKEILGITES